MGWNRLPGRSRATSSLHYFRLRGALGVAACMRTVDRAPSSPSAFRSGHMGAGVHTAPRIELSVRACVARGGGLYLVGVLEINLAKHRGGDLWVIAGIMA